MEKQGDNALELKTVCECNRCLGTITWHPQATIINLEHPGLARESVKFEFYAILLIEECPDGCSCCGRMYYDYAHATMVFLSPGEVFRMSENNTLPEKGWLLAFHPDLLCCTSLKNHIRNYTFFHYRKEEALHLSQRETEKVTCCLWNIEEELHHPIDGHTATILSRHIELVLDYCSRYYERQFITRENKNKALLKRLDRLVGNYISSGKLLSGKEPREGYFAAQLDLSVAYFNDLLRFETGMSLGEYTQLKQMEMAKTLLRKGEMSSVQVACLLGFPSVQYFSNLFKQLTGMSPDEYRYLQN